MPLISDREQILKEEREGGLYLVSTPIGNLDDITPRAIKVLQQADFILAEDTRRTGVLLSHFHIKNRLISCHEHNEASRLTEIVQKIASGAKIALVTDAGTPTISDPGFILVREAIEKGIDVRPIPGVSAAITALSVSGFPTDSFLFLGFPVRKQGRRKEQLRSLISETRTLIFYESPQRIIAFIEELKGIAGDREAVLCREMTKVHEEFIRGRLSVILQKLTERPVVKGECTLVVKGQNDRLTVTEDIWKKEMAKALSSTSEKPSTLAKRISQMTGAPRRQVYEEILKHISRKSDSVGDVKSETLKTFSDSWKLLLVDDEPEVHQLTEIVLEEFQFEGRGLTLLSAFSGEEAKEMMARHPDIALILLDVVMETDSAGLEFVRYVRESLKNTIVQIVLRTGQAGQDPHLEIISKYEINDYHSKVELTAARMITIVTSSLRAYRLSLALLNLNDKLKAELDERKRAQEEIHRLTQFQESVIDSADLWLHVITDTGQVAIWNKAAMTISGYEKAEVADEKMLWKTLLRHNANSSWEESESITLFSDSQELFNREVPITCKSGESRSIIWNSKRLWNHAGDAIGMIFLGRDVTDQKMLERQFRQAQKMEAVGRMAGGVAHDFNNLLTVIRGYCELSMIRLNEQNTLYQKLKQIDRAAEKAENLTRKLLSFSRNHVVTSKRVSLTTLILEIIEMIGRLVPKNIEFVSRVGDEELLILANPGQMEQVIMNLVLNAMDAMKEGGVLTIETCAASINRDQEIVMNGLAAGEYACLSVSDTGVGMDEKTLDRIFEPFFTTKEKGKGTGLGLSTVYGIVKQIDGAIKVSSQPFKGTRFDLYFPMIETRQAFE